MPRIALLAAGLALILSACGGDEAEPAAGDATPDPALEALSAACTEYRNAVTSELPPVEPRAWERYGAERLRLAERFVAAVRAVPEGADPEPRGRLLAAGSRIIATNLHITGSVDQLYDRPDEMAWNEMHLLEEADKVGVRCGEEREIPAERRRFRETAAEVCDASGPVSGVPSRDATLLAERVHGHAAPAEATELERATLAAQAAAARIAARTPVRQRLRSVDARYYALVARVIEGWARQDVPACTDLLTPEQG